MAIPLSAGTLWLMLTVGFSLLVYYLTGVEEGAVRLFGNYMYLHEFLHDARHPLGFPCH